MKIYINRFTGFATLKLGDTSALQSISTILGATTHLDCVFHDGTQAVELAEDATGVCVAKQDKRYTDTALVQALSWTKASAVDDGYRFTLRPSGETLTNLLGNLESVPLMFQIVWSEGGVEYKTQKISFPVANAVYRDDEPVIETPGETWPLPGELLRQSDLSGLSGDVLIGDKTITFFNGLIKTIV